MKKDVAGVDVGTYSIKFVEIESRKDGLELTRCATGLIRDGDVSSTLKKILPFEGVPLKRVNVSLSGPSVIVRYIEIPPMKESELKSAIKFEAEKYIPFSVEDSIIDCAMLGKTSSGAQRVLLAASKKEDVGKLLKLFDEIGLEVNLIDIDSFALIDCFSRLKRDLGVERTYALINMGGTFSNMNIITKGDVYFTRDILWGGMDITKGIKEAMKLSIEEAEDVKQNPAGERQLLLDVITGVLERFVSQVRMSFDYFESQFGRGVEKIYISGGTSYLFNIADFLKDSLGIDVVMWNPFEGIKLSVSFMGKEVQSSPAIFAVAVGLALRK